MKTKDSDGRWVQAGDKIRFSYGIPARLCVAEVIQRGNTLIALTPDDNPKECSVRYLRQYVGEFYRI